MSAAAGDNGGMTGLFITFEGIDGAGKTTHVDALAEALAAQGRRLVRTREPGGTPLAEQLRELVLHTPMDPLTEALLMFAARREHLVQVIEPALARGDVVLCDRFTDATFAYQGGGRGFRLDVLAALESMVQAVPALPAPALRQPHLTVWFDLPPTVAAARLAGVRVPDKFESQPLAFFEAVAAGYAARMAADPGRFLRLDADRPREAVWASLQAGLRERGVLA